MGKAAKKQPSKLASKLLSIRLFLHYTQEEMVKWVIPDVENTRAKRVEISHFETGRRSPSLIEVFHYARAVRELTVYKEFTSDDLIDDERPLPWEK